MYPTHPETWTLAQATAIRTLPSFFSAFLSPHNRPMYVVCALWLSLMGRCYNSLSSCCYSLVKSSPSHHHFQGRELRHSPRVHSSCTGTGPVQWTSCGASSPPTTENTVISEGEDIAHIPAQEVTCSQGTGLGASLLSTWPSPWGSGRGLHVQALAWSILAVPVQLFFLFHNFC